jgi:hypothetical protein
MAQIDIDLEHYNRCESGFGSHGGWVDINNSSNSPQNQWQIYEEFGLTLPIQHQLPTHRQFDPVWPSMLTNPVDYSATLVAPSLVKGNAPRLPSIQATPSLRKLTDSDRRGMCQYHEENPSVKQTEIGGMITSSKVGKHFTN